MITVLLTLTTWYATKIYYTKTFNIQITQKDPSMGHIRCLKVEEKSISTYFFNKSEDGSFPQHQQNIIKIISTGSITQRR